MRTIRWPPDGVMKINALGFAEAYQQSLRVRLAIDMDLLAEEQFISPDLVAARPCK